MRRFLTIINMPFAIFAVLQSAHAADDDAAKAEAAFNTTCRSCHSVKPGDNRLGPHLNGIFGRKAGAAEGFNYSPVVKDSAIVWDEANLDKMIADPEVFLPGNSMKPYPGIKDAAIRKTIIEYLKGAK